MLAEVEESAANNFTKVEQIFGRNLGEFLGAVVGYNVNPRGHVPSKLCKSNVFSD